MTGSVISAIFSFFLLYIAISLFRYVKKRQDLKKIPSPPPNMFFLGNIRLLADDPDVMFERLREFSKKYYPIYQLSTFYVTIVNLLDPNDVEQVLSSTKHLSKSKIYEFLKQWLCTGLLTSTGEKWHHRRKLLTPAFHFTILQQFLTIFNEETAKLVESLEQTHGENVDILPEISNFTLQAIGDTAMGISNMDSNARKQYKEAIYQIGQIFLQRLRKPWYRIQAIYNQSNLAKREAQVVEVLHDFSNKIIAQREEEINNTSLSANLGTYSKRKRLAMLDLLLEAKNKGEDIDYEGIREEVDTFMFEGHDTTAMAISFLFYILATNPDVQEQVYKEIREVVNEDIPTYQQLQDLKYTERCIKEALRLYPSVPFISRFAGEDFTTSTGFKIPKGTVLHIHIFDIHRNPRIFPEPMKFDPDRFLPEFVNSRHPFAYIPFSAGPRNCIGQRFAMLELKSVLCGILRRFWLNIDADQNKKEVQFKPDLVLRPKNDIKIRFTDHS